MTTQSVERLHVFPQNFEFRPKNVARHSAYLGGFFGVAGTISSSIKPGNRIRTQMNFADSDPERVIKFAEVFGGSVRHVSNHNSWEWIIGGTEEILAILSMIGDYLPSRKEIITLTQRLHSINTLDEGYEVIRELRSCDRFANGEPEIYTSLVEDPQFVAGVFDARGAIYPVKSPGRSDEYGYVYYNAHFGSNNLPLLEALKQRFGGSYHVQIPKGTPIAIGDKPYVSVHDRKELILGYSDSLALLRVIKDEVQLKQPEVQEALEYLMQSQSFRVATSY